MGTKRVLPARHQQKQGLREGLGVAGRIGAALEALGS